MPNHDRSSHDRPTPPAGPDATPTPAVAGPRLSLPGQLRLKLTGLALAALHPTPPSPAGPARPLPRVLTIGLPLLASLITGALLLRGAPPAQLSPSDQALRGQPSLGRPDAPVTLALFEDFQCPACAHFTRTFEPLLRREFVDPGLVRLVFVNQAFIGADSLTAARAGECVLARDPAAFWAFKDALYHAQAAENSGWAARPRLVALARGVPGVHAAALDRCLADGAAQPALDLDAAVAARARISGTPTLLLNGRQVRFGRMNDLRAALRAALGEARGAP